MSLAPFNPRDQIQFDLGRGRIALDEASARVAVPPEALSVLCQQAGAEAVRDFGRRIGTDLGRRLEARLTDRLGQADLAGIVDHLGGELALLGFGSLSAEQWGRALVLRIASSPFDAAGDALLSSVIEGALQRAFSRDVAAIVVDRDAEGVRLLLTNPATGATVRGWVDAGTSLGDVLVKLNTASVAG